MPRSSLLLLLQGSHLLGLGLAHRDLLRCWLYWLFFPNGLWSFSIKVYSQAFLLVGVEMVKPQGDLERVRDLVWDLEGQNILVGVWLDFFKLVQDQLGLFSFPIIKLYSEVVAWVNLYVLAPLKPVELDATTVFCLDGNITGQLDFKVSNFFRVQVLAIFLSLSKDLDLNKFGHSVLRGATVAQHAKEALKIINLRRCSDKLRIFTHTFHIHVLSNEYNTISIVNSWHDFFWPSLWEEFNSDLDRGLGA